MSLSKHCRGFPIQILPSEPGLPVVETVRGLEGFFFFEQILWRGRYWKRLRVFDGKKQIIAFQSIVFTFCAAYIAFYIDQRTYFIVLLKNDKFDARYS